ncbi:MAG TPA: HAMP domain-containing sensor histidine kinase [Lachnospiraceae bacterium]|nr:HAMP domain-containing sensor histidine kinase [Lachnospiraceae bacterium]
MSKMNRIILSVLLIGFLFAIVSSVLINNTLYTSIDKEYLVETNRIRNSIEQGIDLSDIDMKDYQRIKGINYLKATEDVGKIQSFMEETPSDPSLQYKIESVIMDDKIDGYIRYCYSYRRGTSSYGVLLEWNILIGIILMAITILLLYIKKELLYPFKELQDMPYDLAKGHLKKGLKESKNRYFGRFLWGLDMLRESLEDHKRKELNLEKQKKTMVLSLSHDIKTPLSMIKLYATAINEDLYESKEKQRETARSIVEKVDQIENYVSEIIRTSQEDLLAIEVKDGEFYLEEVITPIARVYQEKCKLLGIQFAISTFENKIFKGDKDKLVEVLENILENAIKYGDKNYISIDFYEEDYCQLIRVTNSGDPIPSVEFVHMFESFWRGSNAHDKQGNGLGLYICKRIMNLMKGEIFAESTRDTMSIVLVLPS